MNLISVQGISRLYGSGREQVVALKNVSIEIDQGEFVAIMGPSGSGKTTFLSTLGGINPPTTGKVFVDGIECYCLSSEKLADFRRQHFGFVFQQLHLLPYLTAIQNVMLPLVISKQRGSRWELALESLTAVGLQDKPNRLPDQLSLGEQARVCIARALVNAPPILLADEPTGNLDSKTGQDIMGLLNSLYKQGHTIIVVTHNTEAAGAAQRVVYIKDGQIVIKG
ncbi:ABC transporter ATP-binding protein [Chloroflexota bacterium]